MFLSIGFDDGGIERGIEEELFSLWEITSHSTICSYPYSSIMRGEQGVDDAVVGAWQIMGGKFARLLIHAYESISCSYPQYIIVAFCHAEHIVAWQDIRSCGIATITLEAIAVIRLDACVGPYPNQSLLVDEQAVLFFRRVGIYGVEQPRWCIAREDMRYARQEDSHDVSLVVRWSVGVK